MKPNGIPAFAGMTVQLMNMSKEIFRKGMKVAVAMSGGVDSSATVALLKEQGADVFGITLVLHKASAPTHVEDAKRVAETLGVPHHVLDLTDAFSKNIVGEFVDTYLGGETPLPCATCNKKIKFGALMEKAKELGAEALATGHYAILVAGPKGAELHKAADDKRDQSYFLFLASQAQLDFLRFPLGGMKSKKETRALAARFGLPVAEKPDSQDICFVPNGDYAGLVARLRPEGIVPGEIVDEAGKVLGKHEGIIHFTVGQRRGINLSGRVGENNEPLFVLRLDAGKKQVVVGPREALAQKNVYLRGVNWIGGDVPEKGVAVSVKLRSAQPFVSATFRMLEDGRGVIELDEPVFGVAPGQAGVIYSGTRVLGGGWIEGK